MPFVMGGPVLLHGSSHTNICVVHATGLNFSRKTTLDYKRYYCTNDSEFKEIVKRKLAELFHLCFSAAKDLGCTILRVPAIGLGLFMLACSEVGLLMSNAMYLYAHTHTHTQQVRAACLLRNRRCSHVYDFL